MLQNCIISENKSYKQSKESNIHSTIVSDTQILNLSLNICIWHSSEPTALHVSVSKDRLCLQNDRFRTISALHTKQAASVHSKPGHLKGKLAPVQTYQCKCQSIFVRLFIFHNKIFFFSINKSKNKSQTCNTKVKNRNSRNNISAFLTLLCIIWCRSAQRKCTVLIANKGTCVVIWSDLPHLTLLTWLPHLNEE